jgi:hypothetical protein
MKHYSDEELILYRYGECADAEAEAIERHLDQCEACRAEHEALRGALETIDSAPLPSRGEEYPEQVWRRVADRVQRRSDAPWTTWLTWPRLALAGSVAALLVAAFLFGRNVGVDQGIRSVNPIPETVRERILLVAVGDHLERSQRLLVELVNAECASDVDISQSRPLARALAADNRVYRRSAATSGQEALTGVLDELERVLLELANGPDNLSAAELADFRKHIEGRGLLLKVRVLGDDARERGRRRTESSAANQT